MKACITKLRSRRGASLILAAVYFLICAFVGGTVLAAASSGGAHLKNRRAQEQSYQIARSAAQLIQSELTVENGYLQAEITKTLSGGTTSYTLKSVESPETLQGLVCKGAAAKYAQKLGDTGVFSDYKATGKLELELTENTDGVDSTEEHKDTVEIRYAVGDNYDLTVTIGEGEEDSRLCVFMKASVAERSDGITVTWTSPVIRKAGETA